MQNRQPPRATDSSPAKSDGQPASKFYHKLMYIKPWHKGGTHKNVTQFPFIPFPLASSLSLCQHLWLWSSCCQAVPPSPPRRFEYFFHVSKHNLFLILELVQLKRLGAKLPPKLSGLLLTICSVTNSDGMLACDKITACHFSSRLETRVRQGYLCALYEVLNVLCTLYPASIQKIPTAMEKRKRQ